MSVIVESNISFFGYNENTFKEEVRNIGCKVPHHMTNPTPNKDELYPELQKVKENQSKEFNILLEACLELDQEVQEELANNLEKQIQETGEAN